MKPEENEILISKAAEAVMLLFQSVKERKVRELLNEIKNGGSNGNISGVQTQ